MAERFSAFKQSVDEMQKTLIEIVCGDGMTDDELGELSSEQIDYLISCKNKICSGEYLKNIEEADAFKKRYLDLPWITDSEKRIYAILHWGMAYGYKKQFTDYVVKYLERLGGEDVLDDKLKVTYRGIWNAIADGHLRLDTKQVKRIVTSNKGFLTTVSKGHVGGRATAKACGDDGCDDYDVDISMNAVMSGAETFFVSALMASNDLDDKMVGKLLCKIQQACDPRLLAFPMKVTRMKGELIGQILQHYDDAVISPIVKNRRTLGVVLDNEPYKFHKYRDVFGGGGDGVSLYTTCVTIEFPYMCYGCVSHVELETYGGLLTLTLNEDKTTISVFVDTDYVSKPFVDYKVKEQQVLTYASRPVMIQKIDCKDPNKVGVYVTISFSFLGSFMNIKDIRVYGEAISFVA